MATPSHTQVKVPDHDYTAPKLNKREAAEYLGLTLDGLQTMIRQGRGPASYKIGRCVRFSLADLAAFAEKHRRPAA